VAKGDIILITFPFTDLSGSKLRPSVVLADSTQDVTVAFITGQLKWQEQTDLLLTPALNNGLKKPSLIRISKLATLDKTLIKGRMGSLTIMDIKNLDEKLKLTFQLT
jgi:mRNA interferase MazF